MGFLPSQERRRGGGPSTGSGRAGVGGHKGRPYSGARAGLGFVGVSAFAGTTAGGAALRRAQGRTGVGGHKGRPYSGARAGLGLPGFLPSQERRRGAARRRGGWQGDRMIHDGKERYGRYLEDFRVGDVYRHWPGKTITESDNNLFCLLTMNHNPLHLDENVMKDHQHGRILVAGPLVLSVAVGMKRHRYVGAGDCQSGVRAGDARRAGLCGGTPSTRRARCWRRGSRRRGRTGASCTSRRGRTTSATSGC